MLLILYIEIEIVSRKKSIFYPFVKLNVTCRPSLILFPMQTTRFCAGIEYRMFKRDTAIKPIDFFIII